MSEKYELKVAQAVGGKNLPDNEPFDVIAGNHAVEVKTIVDGKNPKITMHAESLTSKEKFARANKMKTHTVAIDARTSPPQYYYSKGMGSFRLSSMEKITIVELRAKFA